MTFGLKTSASAPSSKSHANRLLTLAALDPNPCVVRGLSESTDVVNFLKALRSIGLEISQDKDTVTIHNSFPACERDHDQDLDVGDGGTTARFCIGLLTLGKRRYTVQGQGRLPDRPFSEFFEALEDLGAKAQTLVPAKSLPVLIQGPIAAKSVNVSLERSTQFYSAIKMLSHVVDIEVRKVNVPGHVPYANMTDQLVENFQTDCIVPVDWSSQAYLEVYARATNPLHEKVKTDPLQADSKIVDYLDSTDPLTVNLEEHIDLYAALSFLGMTYRPITMYGLEGLQYKESDRLQELIDIFKLANVDYILQNDFLTVSPGRQLSSPYEYESHDHRSLILKYLIQFYIGDERIREGDEKIIAKSFPGFFDQFQFN